MRERHEPSLAPSSPPCMHPVNQVNEILSQDRRPPPNRGVAAQRHRHFAFNFNSMNSRDFPVARVTLDAAAFRETASVVLQPIGGTVSPGVRPRSAGTDPLPQLPTPHLGPAGVQLGRLFCGALGGTSRGSRQFQVELAHRNRLVAGHVKVRLQLQHDGAIGLANKQTRCRC